MHVGIVLTRPTATFQNPAVLAAPMDEVKRPRVEDLNATFTVG